MAYVDYTYYTDIYLGTLTEAQFNKYSKEAELYLNRQTFNNITVDTVITDSIKDCVCELTDTVYDKSTYANNKNIKSENNDGYSVSYKDNSEVEADFNKKIREIVLLYLDNNDTHNLLYCGVS